MNVVDAAGKDGVQHFLMNSGYRDFREQRQLYEEMGSDYALPAGYSEHNLGLSLDAGSTQKKMEKRLKESGLKRTYGSTALFYVIRKIKVILQVFNMSRGTFVMSGYLIVPLCKKKMTLEEYLDFLKEKKKSQPMWKVRNIRFLIIKFPE